MPKKPDIDRRVLNLFDGYVHGQLSRRDFLERAAAFTTSGVTAAALLASLSPDYALAQHVAPDDPSISADYKRYASRQGAGVMRGYFVRPAVIRHRLPAVLVIHENRGLNPYIEDVARRLAVAGSLVLAPALVFAGLFVFAFPGFMEQPIEPVRGAVFIGLAWAFAPILVALEAGVLSFGYRELTRSAV